MHHAQLIYLVIFQELSEVIALGGIGGCYDRVDIAPLLRPHVAEQVRGNQPIRTVGNLSIFLNELLAHVSVQRDIQGLDLAPEPLQFGAELIRRHVIVGAPHSSGVLEPKIRRTSIRQLDKTRIAFTHGSGNLVPACPGVQQFVGIGAVGQDEFKIVQ